MLYFAVGELGLDGGIEVTASHNPKQYIGMKIVRRGALPVGGESGLLDVRDRAMSGGQAPGPVSPGHVEPYDIWPAFLERVLSFVDVSALRPLRVVIDAANGMGGAMLEPVLERLPIEAVRCNFEPDGTFPNHEPNPLLPENREFIVREDHRGEAPTSESPSTATPTAASSSTTRASSCRATSSPPSSPRRCSRRSRARRSSTTCARAGRCPRRSSARGGIPLVNRVGHAFIKHRMRKEEAVFGGEVSGHYYFRDFSQADSGVIPFLLMLEVVSKAGQAALRAPAPATGRRTSSPAS